MDYLMPPVAPVAFSGVMTFAWIAVFLFIGMILRAIFPPFRRYLIPSCIIGGTIGLLLESNGILKMTGFGMDPQITQLIVFHLFCLTWVYVGLRMPDKVSKNGGTSTKLVLWYFGVYTVAMYASFAACTLATTLLSGVGLNSGPASIGSLISYGFVTGPGQALTVANIWTAATSFTGLPDLALAGGAMGFAVAIIVGIIFLNIIARKKKIDLLTCPSSEEECGYYNECTEATEAGYQTTSPTSIDVLAWHIAIGLVVYLLSYIIAVIAFLILPPAAKILVWSVFFLFGALVGIVVRKIMVKMKKGHLLCNGMNTRISNTLVDFMICGTFISIQVGNVSQYFTPYFASVVASTVAIAGVSWFYYRKLAHEGAESFAFTFGNLTGTVSTGFILLRLLDPNNKTNVAINLGLANALHFTSIIIFPIIMHLEPLYNMPAWYGIASFAGIALLGVIMAYIFRQPESKIPWEPENNK